MLSSEDMRIHVRQAHQNKFTNSTSLIYIYQGRGSHNQNVILVYFLTVVLFPALYFMIHIVVAHMTYERLSSNTSMTTTIRTRLIICKAGHAVIIAMKAAKYDSCKIWHFL